MEDAKNKPDKDKPIQIIDAKLFMRSAIKVNDVDYMISISPEAAEEAVKDFNEGKNQIISYEHKPKKSEESIFLDLNSVLVKFWRENGVMADTELKIRLLERMVGWYKKMGTITLNDFTLTD